jgi:hypothetical protein
MTWAERLTCTDPVRMLHFLIQRGQADLRRVRLFLCACCREVWDLIEQMEREDVGSGCEAVRLAEGLATPQEVRAAIIDYHGLTGLLRGGRGPRPAPWLKPVGTVFSCRVLCFSRGIDWRSHVHSH